MTSPHVLSAPHPMANKNSTISSSTFVFLIVSFYGVKKKFLQAQELMAPGHEKKIEDIKNLGYKWTKEDSKQATQNTKMTQSTMKKGEEETEGAVELHLVWGWYLQRSGCLSYTVWFDACKQCVCAVVVGMVCSPGHTTLCRGARLWEVDTDNHFFQLFIHSLHKIKRAQL